MNTRSNNFSSPKYTKTAIKPASKANKFSSMTNTAGKPNTSKYNTAKLPGSSMFQRSSSANFTKRKILSSKKSVKRSLARGSRASATRNSATNQLGDGQRPSRASSKYRSGAELDSRRFPSSFNKTGSLFVSKKKIASLRDSLPASPGGQSNNTFSTRDNISAFNGAKTSTTQATSKIVKEGEFIIKIGTKTSLTHDSKSSVKQPKHNDKFSSITSMDMKSSHFEKNQNSSQNNTKSGYHHSSSTETATSSALKESNLSQTKAAAELDAVATIQLNSIYNFDPPTEKNFADNTDLEVIHPCENFVAIMASTLAKLDYNLALSKKGSETVKDNHDLRKLKHAYKKFASKFVGIGKIKNSVFVYSLALARKVQVVAAEHFSFNLGEFLLIYAGCLFLSIKMVVDTEKWFIEDFSTVSGIDQSTIQKMELFILEDALQFDVSIDSNTYRQEHLRTYKNIERRVSKQKARMTIEGCGGHRRKQSLGSRKKYSTLTDTQKMMKSVSHFHSYSRGSY